MPVSLKTQAERTAKTPIPACRARVGGLCGFRGTAERVPAGSPKTGRCTAVRERWQKTSEQDEMAAGKAACGKCRKNAENGQNRGILDAAARKQEKGLTLFCVWPSTSARSAGSFGDENGAFLRLSKME